MKWKSAYKCRWKSTSYYKRFINFKWSYRYKKNDEKISDFLKDKNIYNNNFNLCQNCKVNQNAFYCEICQKNLCRQCRDNNEICHHIVINLSNSELKAKEDKVDIYKMSYNLFLDTNKENLKRNHIKYMM